MKITAAFKTFLIDGMQSYQDSGAVLGVLISASFSAHRFEAPTYSHFEDFVGNLLTGTQS